MNQATYTFVELMPPDYVGLPGGNSYSGMALDRCEHCGQALRWRVIVVNAEERFHCLGRTCAIKAIKGGDLTLLDRMGKRLDAAAIAREARAAAATRLDRMRVFVEEFRPHGPARKYDDCYEQPPSIEDMDIPEGWPEAMFNQGAYLPERSAENLWEWHEGSLPGDEDFDAKLEMIYRHLTRR